MVRRDGDEATRARIGCPRSSRNEPLTTEVCGLSLSVCRDEVALYLEIALNRLMCARIRQTAQARGANENGEVGPMLFEGQTMTVDTHDGGLAELRFARGVEAINKLDALAFGELRRAIDSITATPAIRGVLITSAKDNFIVGADIFEFTGVFKRPEKDIAAFVGANSEIITALSDLPVPTVAAINGLALGGGLELTLAADYRVMSSAAKIGFPEISLGLFPGYGGTVRLPRLAGLRPSAAWIIFCAQH